MSTKSTNPGLELWQKVEKTDPVMAKPVEYGKRKFTSIDQTYQRKRAVELWGTYGTTWGLRNMRWGYVTGPDHMPVEMWVEAEFYWPDGAFEISSDMRWERGGDTRKKLQTDCWKKALAYLGFSADIYMGAFDDEKYQADKAGKPQDQKVEDILAAISSAPDEKTLNTYMLKAQSYGLSSYYLAKCHYALEARKSELQGGETF